MHAVEQSRAPETKAAGDPSDIAEAFGDFMSTFEAFRESNDQRLAEIERRSTDALTVEKVERISKALDEQKRALDGLALKRTREPEHEITAETPCAEPEPELSPDPEDAADPSDDRNLETVRRAVAADRDDPDVLPEF